MSWNGIRNFGDTMSHNENSETNSASSRLLDPNFIQTLWRFLFSLARFGKTFSLLTLSPSLSLSVVIQQLVCYWFVFWFDNEISFASNKTPLTFMIALHVLWFAMTTPKMSANFHSPFALKFLCAFKFFLFFCRSIFFFLFRLFA